MHPYILLGWSGFVGCREIKLSAVSESSKESFKKLPLKIIHMKWKASMNTGKINALHRTYLTTIGVLCAVSGSKREGLMVYQFPY
jgi:hypothetical protein